MTKADLGLSMVVAPAYIIHLKLSQISPAITFGVAEYLVQALLLVCLSLALRKFHRSFLLSFLSVLFYGRVLDGFLWLLSRVAPLTLGPRMIFFLGGILLCALGVSFVLHTYLPPEVYELVVKEVSRRFHLSSSRVKTIYDWISCGAAVGLSFLFFGFPQFRGVEWGTLFCALITGFCVGFFNRNLEKIFIFSPAFPRLARWFESSAEPS